MATGGADPGEAERHLSECPVCLEVYVDPKVLPCDHSLCAGCVQQLKQGSRIECPLCKVVHDVSRIRPDFRLQQFLDALTEKQKKEGGGTNKERKGYFMFQSYSKFVALSLVQYNRQYVRIATRSGLCAFSVKRIFTSCCLKHVCRLCLKQTQIRKRKIPHVYNLLTQLDKNIESICISPSHVISTVTM